jgi:protein-S-isoprenylcysteine O-methyltransferase Ste14
MFCNIKTTFIFHGAYHYVRHPSYTAGAILFLGWRRLAIRTGAT